METGVRKRQKGIEIEGLEEPEGQRVAEIDEQRVCLLPALCPSSPPGPWLTQATGTVQAAGITTGTGAHVAPDCVGAVAPGAEAWHADTLVHIYVDTSPVRVQPPSSLTPPPPPPPCRGA